MLNPAFVGKFIDWLKPGDKQWEDRGLKDDAPESAKIAYKEYQEIMKEAEKKGYEI